jgi:TM2 domain-containing membrane protein YozV
MDCVNHSGVTATAYCQNCGKALCADCVRKATGGQVFCEPCLTAWQSYQQPFVAPPASAPSPGLAAVLGLIPGVGAMYNGQFIKGLIHVVIFAVLVSAANNFGIFGILVAGWIFYQAFDAYHTAKARRDGLPLPDPLGLNEVGNWLRQGNQPYGPVPPPPGAAGPEPAGQYQPPYQAPPYQQPASPPPFTPPFADLTQPPVPPVPPSCWRRREPIGAVILIALGLLFLLGQMDILSGRMLGYLWPLILIGLGVWLIFRRYGESQGGSK